MGYDYLDSRGEVHNMDPRREDVGKTGEIIVGGGAEETYGIGESDAVQGEYRG